MGSKLVVSFANPAKHYDNHAIRPQSNGMGSALVGGANGKLGLRANSGAGSGLLTGCTGLGSKAGFSDRLSPIGSFPNARGRGLWPLQTVWLTHQCLHVPSSATGRDDWGTFLQAISALLGSLGLEPWVSIVMTTWQYACNSKTCKCSRSVSLFTVDVLLAVSWPTCLQIDPLYLVLARGNLY